METSKMPNFEPQRKQNFENKINALEPLFTAEVKFSNSSYRFHEIVICTNPEQVGCTNCTTMYIQTIVPMTVDL